MLSTCRQDLRLRCLAITALLLLICAGLIVYARTSRGTTNPYALAEDFPRGALVYAQFGDLPALIKQWDESRLKQQYLNSVNYQQFQHRHLALKLIERWEEFNGALGFQLDTAAISRATEASAAVAIYDIGQLDLVLIAPMSDEKIAATQFWNNKGQFEERKGPDGTTYYRHEVDADRGRQKQMLAFATLKGRFILASNEKLLLRSIANINRKAKKDSLADDPAFKTLTQRLSPHFAAVWVDQTKLNEDYYFKHYWLMQNVSQLKGIRAGLFDLEQQEGKWIERREFLAAGNDYRKSSGISAAEAGRLSAMMPGDAPFVKLQSLANDPNLISTVARDTLFDSSSQEGVRRGSSWSWRSYDTGDFYLSGRDDGEGSYDRYSYLGSSYDSTIDDPHDAKITRPEEPAGDPLATESEHQFLSSLQQSIAPARPSLVALGTSPYTVADPLFVEFRKVAILTLQAPGNLQREVLETAITRAAQSRLTVAGPTADLKWESHGESDRTWRELRLPMLGWEVCYALRDRELILTNSSELLKAVLDLPEKKETLGTSPAGLDDLTIIRFDRRKQAFDDIMNRLDADSLKSRRQSRNQNKDANRPSEEFFSGNMSSLLNVASDVSRIEIKRSAASNYLHEEIEFILK